MMTGPYDASSLVRYNRFASGESEPSIPNPKPHSPKGSRYTQNP